MNQPRFTPTKEQIDKFAQKLGGLEMTEDEYIATLKFDNVGSDFGEVFIYDPERLACAETVIEKSFTR